MADPAIISALAALAGSAVGAVASFATSWSTQQAQHSREIRQRQRSMREGLYIAFIEEASTLYADAVTNHPESIDGLVRLHGLIGKMRLCAPDDVCAESEAVVEQIVEAYFAPNRTLEELRRERAHLTDPLATFSERCRDDLMKV